MNAVVRVKWAVAMSVAGLSACATPTLDQVHGAAGELLDARTSVPNDGREGSKELGTADLLTRPVDADGAVRIALLKNPRVVSIYSQLGFARADLYDAARLSNPVVGYVGLFGSGLRKTDWSLSQNFTEVLFYRVRVSAARSALMLTEQRVAQNLLDLEADVRAAHVRYVGSRIIASMRDRIARSADVAARYAQQLFEAGNISRLQLARWNEASDLARTESLKARANETAERNALLTLMGLGADERVTFIGDFAFPTPEPVDASALRNWALGNRLDLLSAREALRFAAMSEVHARRWRLLGDSSIGMAAERDGTSGASAGETLKGPSAGVSIPLFNHGAGTVGRARAAVEMLTGEVKTLELSISNDIDSKVNSLEAARHSVTLYRENILGLQRTMLAESRKQQNYMLIGTFDLLDAKQRQYEGYEAYVRALSDYWLSVIELNRATGGRYPGSTSGERNPRMEPLPADEAGQGEQP